jgi:phage major head subunit gpT-like protein
MAVIVTREMIANLTAGVKSIYQDAYMAQGGVWQSISTLIESTLAVETYAWLSELPIMREFVDERVIKQLSEYSYSIRNRKFEATIGVAREVLEDEQLGQVKIRVQSMAEAAAQHFDQLLFTLIEAGSTTACFDGQNFYSANHLQGGQNNSNVGVAVLTSDALEAAIVGMQRIPLDNGQPMAVKPTHILVPPELSFTAKRILNSTYYPEATGTGLPGNMAENPLKGSLQIVESARLTSATEWHLFDCSHPVKPFVLQQRVAPEVRALDGSEGETETTFLRDVYLYGVRSRDNAGYGLWQYAYKSTGAGS